MRIEIIRINCFLSIFDRILMEFMNYGNVKDSMVHGIPIESLMLGVWFLYGFHGYGFRIDSMPSIAWGGG